MEIMGLVYLTLLLLFWRTLGWRPRAIPGLSRNPPLLIGHRGVRGLKAENTLEAFKMAFETGLDGIETDVQRSRDGQLLLFHDFELEGRRIDTLSYEQILRLDPSIPTLKDLLALARAYPGTLLNLELKAEGLKTKGLERDTIKEVFHSGLEARIILSSFHPVSLLRVRLLAPRLRTGLLYSPDMPRFLRAGFLAAWLHVDAIHPHESQVTAELFKRASRRGLMLNTWTVNDPLRIKSLYQMGIDGIIGDDPAVLRQSLEQVD